jgi:hypothetical protein
MATTKPSRGELEALLRISRRERLGRLEFARSISCEDLAARHSEFLHRSALREVQIGQWNPEGIGAGGLVEEQDLVLFLRSQTVRQSVDEMLGLVGWVIPRGTPIERMTLRTLATAWFS